MKINLINPPNLVSVDSVWAVRTATPSTSLPYLSSILKKNKYEVKIIDALGIGINKYEPLQTLGMMIRGENAESIVGLLDKDCDVVGISCMFSNEWLYVKEIIKKIKARYPEKIVIVGGEHVSADPEYIFKSAPNVDIVVVGEGEYVFLELLNALNKKLNLESIPSIVYKNIDNKIIKTIGGSRIRHIDELPWPDWSDIPLDNYFSVGSGITTFNGKVMPMISSRGCPYRCTFCSNPSMWGTRWVNRSAEDVISEIKSYVKTYNVSHFEFHDLTAIVNKAWTLEFTKLLIKENLKITWSLPSGTRSEALDFEVLNNLYLSGCKKISFAPESGSNEELIRIKKKVNLKNMLKSMEISVNIGIIVRSHIIVGFPGQKFIDLFRSYLLILKMMYIGVHDVSVYFFVPYPGSELFRDLRASGQIPVDIDEFEYFLLKNICNNTDVKSWSEHLSDIEIKYFAIFAMSSFYIGQFLLRPKRLLMLIRNFKAKNPSTIFEQYMFKKFDSLKMI